MGKHLVYTVALDPAGASGHRNLAKMLVSSLLRTHFSGDIVVFHNSAHPIFMVARQGVREVRIDLGDTLGKNGTFTTFAQSAKHAVAEHLDGAAYDKVMFIDCDAVVLRNIDHLLAGDWDLAYFPETGTRIQKPPYGGYLSVEEEASLAIEGVNSGQWAVSGKRLAHLLRRWREVDTEEPRFPCFREQSAFNRVVLDWDGRAIEWPRREIALPLCEHNLISFNDYTGAALVHAASGAPADYKLRFLFSVFAGTFLFDPQLALFNIMEM